MSKVLRGIGWKGYVAVALLFIALSSAAAQEVVLPEPEQGSFFSIFNYLRDGRIAAFDGFTVYVQENNRSSNLVPIGSLPVAFLGATDPAFIAVSPDGRELILGAGAGGSKFPDPAFNGNMFSLPIEGGVAELIGQFPYHIEATFRRPGELVFGQGETFGFFVGSVEHLDLKSGRNVSIVANIPGDPGGVVFDKKGNLYVGLGAASEPTRVGEIHRFDKRDVVEAIRSGIPLDFNTDSEVVAQVLNAGDLKFDSKGDLYVGGGDLFGVTGSFGFIAKVDVKTGEIIERFDPIDGDPDDSDFVFFSLGFTPVRCRLGALDLISFFTADEPTIFERKVCGR